MKMPIGWHRKCLLSMGHVLQQQEGALKRLNEDVERLRYQVRAYEQQIQDAIAKRKSGFDADKFGKKLRVPPTT